MGEHKRLPKLEPIRIATRLCRINQDKHWHVHHTPTLSGVLLSPSELRHPELYLKRSTESTPADAMTPQIHIYLRVGKGAL